MVINLCRRKTIGSINSTTPNQNKKKKTVTMMITVVVAFGLCWTPWHLFKITQIFWKNFKR